jgi:fructosamine-3-kinase
MLLLKTSVPVARIIVYDDSHELIDRDFLIMERLPGRPLTEVYGIDYDFVLRQVGEYLAQAHSLHEDRYGYLGAHKPMIPQETWLEAFQIMWNKMIEDIAFVGHYNQDECQMMRLLLNKHIELFDRPIPSSFLHMDIWHQNILVDEFGNVTGIVDWDRALWGDPEIEFAVLDYCGVSEPAFWEGYGKERDMSPSARTRQIFYLLYELQKYIVIRQGRGNDYLGAKRYKQQVMGIVNQYLSN